MGAAWSKRNRKTMLKRRTPDNGSKEGPASGDEMQQPDLIGVIVSGRTYALKDARWVLETTNELRPLERDPKANKLSEILMRENSSLRLKISRLLDMLHVSHEIGRLSVMEKRLDGTNATQESKMSTLRIQTETGQVCTILPGHPGSGTPSAYLPLKIPESDRIRRRLEGVLFAVGQPILDVVARVTVEFLDSFNLPDIEVHELEDNEMGLVNLLFEVFPVEYLTGGSAQNCLIMSQWLFGVPKATTFAGCIGKDGVGDILTKTLAESGINSILSVQDGHETGLCIVLENSRGRRMALRLGAAKSSIRTALDQPQNRALMCKARCFYLGAYSLNYSLDAALEVGRYAAANDRYFCMNLTPTHAFLRPVEGFVELLPYVDVIFAGETEVQAYATMLGLSGSVGGLEASAVGLSGWRKENGLKGRIVVVVQPMKDTVFVWDGELAMFPSMHPGHGHVVDDIGFTDAFAGAFMAVLILGGSVDECLEAGVRAATFSLFVRGCPPPKTNVNNVRKMSRRDSVSI